WSMLVREREGALVVISTSYLDEAAACDRLAYLDGGRLVATGPPEALKRDVPLDLYRAWGDDARSIARPARALPYLHGGRATGRFARIEVRRDRTPGTSAVLHDLTTLAGRVRFAEQAAADMESTLLALAQGLVHA